MRGGRSCVEQLAAGDVDEVAVYRAKHGEAVRLNGAERLVAVAELTRVGESARRIAERVARSPRTVQRYRARGVGAGLLAPAVRPRVAHGTPAGSASHRGRHERLCDACRTAEVAARAAAQLERVAA